MMSKVNNDSDESNIDDKKLQKHYSYEEECFYNNEEDSNQLIYNEYEDESSNEQEFYYNYWNAPRDRDNRELIPSSIKEWLSQFKDPEKEFCKVVAIFLFTFIVSLQIFSYMVSMFELRLTIPYCGELKGELQFECHLWLFLFAWIACFVCTFFVMVLRFLIWLCRHKTQQKKFE